jgi:hypothetical protein
MVLQFDLVTQVTGLRNPIPLTVKDQMDPALSMRMIPSTNTITRS